jgi:hypothetical protein
MNKFFVIGLIAAFMAVTLVPTSLAAGKEELATTLPGGFYWYAYGASGFPDSHKFFQLWQETNGHADLKCGITEATPPIWHVGKGSGHSGLQVDSRCGYGADSFLTP